MDFQQDLLIHIEDDEPSLVHFEWLWNHASESRNFISLDVLLSLEKPSADRILDIKNANLSLREAPLFERFVKDCIRIRRDHQVRLKCVLPALEGHIIRSDLLEFRLPRCDSIERVATFIESLEFVRSVPYHVTFSRCLPDIAPYIIGSILLPESLRSDGKAHHEILEDLLEAGLNFQWVSKERPKKSRIVWVGGRVLDAGNHVLNAAIAMGVSLVVVEGPGHRLEDDDGPAGNLREAFIPMSMATDAHFITRLVDAVNKFSASKPVDGLCTIDEIYSIQVARACEILGLSSTAPECYDRALNKFTTRIMEPDTFGAFRVLGLDGLREYLASQKIPFPYPMVVRPCVGWSSQCVTKVHNQDELLIAVHKASSRHAVPNNIEWYESRIDVVVEPYIEGPEVDANLILLDGELLFCEISDDFPSPADMSTSQQYDNFLETVQLIPTNLPVHEQSVMKNNIYQSILRQGFQTGVFHCEARIQGSSMRYTIDEGFLDLRYNGIVRPQAPLRTFLHEINPRPPAYQSSMAIMGAYGVDYYALHMAACINDKARFRAFSQPFKNLPQHTAAVKYFHEPVPGVMITNDVAAELLQRLPSLASNIPLFKTLKRKGEKLNGPKGVSFLSFLAYFVVISQVSRRHCLELVKRIEEEFQFAME